MRSQYLLIKNVLNGFGICVIAYPDKIIIKNPDSIVKATNLPFFLHATEKQLQAQKLTEIVRVRRRMARNSFDIETKNKIKEWSKHGFSHGFIAIQSFKETGISLSVGQMRYYLKQLQKEEQKL